MRGEYSTKQRQLILSFLKENNAHVSPSDIVYHLKEQGYPVSTATVYRTLDRFAAEGIVRKVDGEHGAGSYYQYTGGDGCNEHFHLKCISCGKLIHMSCDFLQSMENHILQDHGFVVSSGRTIIYGTCSDCNSSENTSSCTTCCEHNHK